MKSRAHVFISGRVQGVFFRSHTRERARQLGLKGWVRNLPDGKVEAIFEGDEEAIRRVLEWCREGPPHARVTDVKMVWEDFKGEYNTFEVRYA